MAVEIPDAGRLREFRFEGSESREAELTLRCTCRAVLIATIGSVLLRTGDCGVGSPAPVSSLSVVITLGSSPCSSCSGSGMDEVEDI